MNDTTLLFGIHAVTEAIKSKTTIDKLFIQKGLKGELIKELMNLINKEGISYKSVPFEKLNKLTSKNHQGIVAYISPVKFWNLEELVESSLTKKEPTFFILLDRITDVRNFGAIIRSAECVGADGIIISKSESAPVNGDCIKTSAGAIFNVPICKVDHLKDAIYHLQSYDIQVIAATEKTDTNMHDINYSKKAALIMGSEGKGIHKSILNIVDEKAKIPMKGTINSLNVSVAAGILMYKITKN